jgi:hypothetical protein
MSDGPVAGPRERQPDGEVVGEPLPGGDPGRCARPAPHTAATTEGDPPGLIDARLESGT